MSGGWSSQCNIKHNLSEAFSVFSGQLRTSIDRHGTTTAQPCQSNHDLLLQLRFAPESTYRAVAALCDTRVMPVIVRIRCCWQPSRLAQPPLACNNSLVFVLCSFGGQFGKLRVIPAVGPNNPRSLFVARVTVVGFNMTI